MSYDANKGLYPGWAAASSYLTIPTNAHPKRVEYWLLLREPISRRGPQRADGQYAYDFNLIEHWINSSIEAVSSK